MVKARALALRREAEGEREVQPKAKKALGTTSSSPSVPMRLPSQQSHSSYSSAQWEHNRQEKQEAQTGCKKKYFYPEDNNVLNELAQVGCAWRFSTPENPEQPNLIAELTLPGAEVWMD